MSKIDYIIDESNYELVTSQIAQILALELANQKVMMQAAIDGGGLTPQQEASYQLSIDCIPDVVYEERSVRPSNSEVPFVNVGFTLSPLNELVTQTTQVGEVVFLVETWQQAKSSSQSRGDTLSTKRAKRLLSICNKILMDRNYVDLGLTGIVGYRKCTDIKIGQPETGANDSNNSIYGNFEIIVKLGEVVPEYIGMLLHSNYTTLKLNDTEKGYSWESTFN